MVVRTRHLADGELPTIVGTPTDSNWTDLMLGRGSFGRLWWLEWRQNPAAVRICFDGPQRRPPCISEALGAGVLGGMAVAEVHAPALRLWREVWLCRRGISFKQRHGLVSKCCNFF